jgi:hypothetical protein
MFDVFIDSAAVEPGELHPRSQQLVGVDAHSVAKHDVVEGVATHSAAPRDLLDGDSNHRAQHVDGRRTARQ